MDHGPLRVTVWFPNSVDGIDGPREPTTAPATTAPVTTTATAVHTYQRRYQGRPGAGPAVALASTATPAEAAGGGDGSGTAATGVGGVSAVGPLGGGVTGSA